MAVQRTRRGDGQSRAGAALTCIPITMYHGINGGDYPLPAEYLYLLAGIARELSFVIDRLQSAIHLAPGRGLASEVDRVRLRLPNEVDATRNPRVAGAARLLRQSFYQY